MACCDSQCGILDDKFDRNLIETMTISSQSVDSSGYGYVLEMDSTPTNCQVGDTLKGYSTLAEEDFYYYVKEVSGDDVTAEFLYSHDYDVTVDPDPETQGIEEVSNTRLGADYEVPSGTLANYGWGITNLGLTPSMKFNEYGYAAPLEIVSLRSANVASKKPVSLEVEYQRPTGTQDQRTIYVDSNSDDTRSKYATYKFISGTCTVCDGSADSTTTRPELQVDIRLDSTHTVPQTYTRDIFGTLGSTSNSKVPEYKENDGDKLVTLRLAMYHAVVTDGSFHRVMNPQVASFGKEVTEPAAVLCTTIPNSSDTKWPMGGKTFLRVHSPSSAETSYSTTKSVKRLKVLYLYTQSSSRRTCDAFTPWSCTDDFLDQLMIVNMKDDPYWDIDISKVENGNGAGSLNRVADTITVTGSSSGGAMPNAVELDTAGSLPLGANIATDDDTFTYPPKPFNEYSDYSGYPFWRYFWAKQLMTPTKNGNVLDGLYSKFRIVMQDDCEVQHGYGLRCGDSLGNGSQINLGSGWVAPDADKKIIAGHEYEMGMCFTSESGRMFEGVDERYPRMYVGKAYVISIDEGWQI